METSVFACNDKADVDLIPKMDTLSIDTADPPLREEFPIFTAHNQCTVQPSVITPMSETDIFNTTLNKDSFKGCWNLLTSGQESTRGLLSGCASDETVTRARTLPDDHTDGRLLTFESQQTQSSIQNNKFMSGQVALTFDGKNVVPDGKNVPNNIPRTTETTTSRILPADQVDTQTGLLLTCRLVSPISESSQQNQASKFGSRQVTVGVKEKFDVRNVPNTHTVITKSQEAKYKHCAAQIASLNEYLSKNKHTSNPESRILYAAAMAHVPALAHERASHFIGLANCAFLSAAGITYSPDQVMKTSPGQEYLRESVKHAAVSSLLLVADELESVSSIYIAVDKAPGAEGGFVKYLTWCNHETQTVKKFFLDAEGSGGFAHEGAEAIAYSLRKLPQNKRMLSGQVSDNGGGLSIEPLAKELTALGLTTDNYLIANCTLHNAQLSLTQPYERVFGVGKTDVRNALQLLFYAHTLQEAYGAESAFPRIFKVVVH
jgi:hypothetical protein